MRTGLIFDDRYRLDERIAAGGVGQVWLARDLLLERAVAVKVLRPEYADHPETLDRFRKEALHAGAISHPNVAQVYDYGAAGLDGSPYLVMEYVDGSSLADLLAVDPLGPARALDIVAQAADGLSAAHHAGLVHRDVKPGNILITSRGLVKVTDFGIAHAAGQAPVTGPGLVMGTTQYMAPERISGKQGTPASDLYALGIVLHECLTGVPPHDGSPAEVMAAHLYLPLPPLPSGTPTEIEDLVARLTVKDPARRISDARELADRAAALRDSLRRVPPTRAGVHSGPLAFAAEPAPVPVPAPAPALSGALAIADRGPARPDEWTTPGRTAPPTNPPTAARADRPGPPPSPRQSRRREKRRQKAGVLAAGAAIVACAVFAALLMSGAFNEAPAANQAPAAPANGTPTPGTVPTQSPSATASAGGVTHSAATPSAMVGQPATGGNQSAAGSSARPASGSPTAGSSGTGSSTTGSSTTGSSTTGSSTTGAPVSAAPASTVPAQASASQAPATPSSAPATPAGSTPTPTSGSSVCILVICL